MESAVKVQDKLALFDEVTRRLFVNASAVAELFGSEEIRPEFVVVGLCEETDDMDVCSLMFDIINSEDSTFRSKYLMYLADLYWLEKSLPEMVNALPFVSGKKPNSNPEILPFDKHMDEILAEAIKRYRENHPKNSDLIPADYVLAFLFDTCKQLDMLDLTLENMYEDETPVDDDGFDYYGYEKPETSSRVGFTELLERVSEVMRVDFAPPPSTSGTSASAKTIKKAGSKGTVKLAKNFKSKKVTLAQIEAHLRKHVIGQLPAIEAIMQSIKLAEAGLKDPVKPIGVFLFAGYTGVGKTELARQLSVAAGMTLKRFDMSEYKESHEYAKLIGSPPGYVGYEEGGQLTNFVRSNPKSVIVFDEVDKAHSTVMNILLQIAEEGSLTDGLGETVKFDKTIVILTSNVGAGEATKKSVGFNTGDTTANEQHAFDEAIKKYFKPELLGRVNTVIFNPLTPEGISLITALELRKLNSRLKCKLRILPSVRKRIASASDTHLYGARQIKSTIDRDVTLPLSEYVLSRKHSEKETITISYHHRTRKYVFSSV